LPRLVFPTSAPLFWPGRFNSLRNARQTFNQTPCSSPSRNRHRQVLDPRAATAALPGRFREQGRDFLPLRFGQQRTGSRHRPSLGAADSAYLRFRQSQPSSSKRLVLGYATASSVIDGTEMPNCPQWVTAYAPDNNRWMDVCDRTLLKNREKSMRDLLTNIARQDGENKSLGSGMELGWIQELKRPVDIYFAEWTRTGVPSDPQTDQIGYFLFIDGGFRWDFLMQFIEQRTGPSLMSPPRRIRTVEPIYPHEAEAKGIQMRSPYASAFGIDASHFPCAFKINSTSSRAAPAPPFARVT
jgi:hypothetical protein